MLYKRRRKSENNRIFVDLEEYTDYTDTEDHGVIVKTVNMKSLSDLEVIVDMISPDCMVVVETSGFEEGEKVRRDALNKMKTLANGRGGNFFEISDRVAIIVPSGIKVERRRIRRKT